jgi:site-specific DNA-methyltransferase (adenine-specific)
MIELNRIYNEDCLEGMKRIPDKSIDMILCDLPYGTTQNRWDSVIPFEPLWGQYKRIIKANGAIVLTATQPFTTALINSNQNEFRYLMVWNKKNTTGFLNARRQPLRQHEDILVFYRRQPTYNPQMVTRGTPRNKGSYNKRKGNGDGCYGRFENQKSKNNTYYPTSIIEFSNAHQSAKVHPTQKPVELFEYLIKTYTNEGETVLDNCMGSGTTAIACINTGRNFIGFELDKHYCEIANERIRKALAEKAVGE